MTTAIQPDRFAAAPVRAGRRITNLDLVRGVALLGILVMNAVSYALPMPAYFNLRAGGSSSWLDWTIGVAGEVFVDQKTMALFSMLFGAGIVLFADRAAAKNVNGTGLSLWRNVLLLVIGLAHGLLWDGDVLVVYAVCAPVLIALRTVRPSRLFVLGTMLTFWSAIAAVLVQPTIGAGGAGLGEFWLTDGSAMSDAVGLFLINDFVTRALGMMLIGIALYRRGVLQGERSDEFYWSMVRWGLGIGLPIAAGGVALQAAYGFGPEIAVVGEAPNTLATIPVACGYIGVITLLGRRMVRGWAAVLRGRLEAAGRMALTNYLTQTVIGVAIFRWSAGSAEPSRVWIAAFVVGVWILQLAWSAPWLAHFRFGPAEWLWRIVTYRRWENLRR